MQNENMNQFDVLDNKNTPKTGHFSDGGFHVFLHKKTERIVTALYLLTNFFSEHDPLRLKMRESALRLMERGAAFLRSPHLVSLLEDVRTDMIAVSSLCHIAFVNKFVSESNFEVMRKESEAFLAQIEERMRADNTASPLLESSFFSVPESSIHSLEQKNTVRLPSLSAQGTINDHPPSFSKGHRGNMSFRPLRTRRRENKFFEEIKSKRYQVIVDALKKKNGLGIKDFSKIIKDRSKKTIQRELIDLVAQGVLKKDGERRWSRYSLI